MFRLISTRKLADSIGSGRELSLARRENGCPSIATLSAPSHHATSPRQSERLSREAEKAENSYVDDFGMRLAKTIARSGIRGVRQYSICAIRARCIRCCLRA